MLITNLSPLTILSKYNLIKNGIVTQDTNWPMMTQARPNATFPLTFWTNTSPEFIVVGIDKKTANAYFAIGGMKLT